MKGPHFRDYHLLLDEQGEQIFAMSDDVAERARKLGGTTLRSIGDISRNQRLKDNDQAGLSPKEMLSDLCSDNQKLIGFLRSTHEVCDEHNDVENWIDESERRHWFLAETVGGME
jgi:starvation-inducible DNA-binding protein